nr:recombination protein NinG [Paenacidovorax monticola]
MAECQAIVNKIVRLRDAHMGCCSCERGPGWDGQWHASHLRSVGVASAVRFNLWNIHKGCSICNNHLSGNPAEYLPRVRARIGDDKVDWLYQLNQVVTYDIEYLKRFKAVMGKKLRRMEQRA